MLVKLILTIFSPKTKILASSFLYKKPADESDGYICEGKHVF